LGPHPMRESEGPAPGYTVAVPSALPVMTTLMVLAPGSGSMTSWGALRAEITYRPVMLTR